MIRDLERLVWRYRNGACSAGGVERALRSELHRLVHARGELNARAEELRRYSAETLRRFDSRVEAALRYLGTGTQRFAEALKAIREAAATLEALHSIDDSLKRLEKAQVDREQLFQKL